MLLLDKHLIFLLLAVAVPLQNTFFASSFNEIDFASAGNANILAKIRHGENDPHRPDFPKIFCVAAATWHYSEKADGFGVVAGREFRHSSF